MQSSHLHSVGVTEYHFLSFVHLIVPCQKIAIMLKDMSERCLLHIRSDITLKAGVKTI